MKPVTDPKILEEFHSTGAKPVNDPALIAEFNGEGNQRQNDPSGIMRIASDILIGKEDFRHGLLSTPHNFADLISAELASHVPKPKDEDYGKMFGINNPTLLDQLIQGSAKYAPYGLLGMVMPGAAAGAITGATQSENPIKGALEGAASVYGLGKAGQFLGKGAKGISNYLKQNQLVKGANQQLNDLVSGLEGKENIPKVLTKHLQELLKANRNEAEVLAEPLNNAKVRFDLEKGEQNFPNYNKAAKELLSKRENSINLFGKDSDLGTNVNKELDFAENFIKNKDKFGATFQEIWERLKNIGEMASSARSAGNRDQARLLTNLRTGLSKDLAANLKSQGHEDLLESLLKFNQHYKNKIVPLRSTKVLREASEAGMPSDNLARNLYKSGPLTSKVFSQLSPEMKDAALYHLITQGKGSSQGVFKGIPDVIGERYDSLLSNMKSLISSHSPEIDQNMEMLADIFRKKSAHEGIFKKASKIFSHMRGGI